MIRVGCLVKDLIFATKIQSTAQVLGIEVLMMRNALQVEQAGNQPMDRWVIDLNLEGQDVMQIIRSIKQRNSDSQVIGFLSHVQAELAQAARQAGADLVLSRSRFSAELPKLLSQKTDEPVRGSWLQEGS